MIYAPIIITTLNRYEHFKRLIESLRKNSWADKTDIFISVDYPPSLKYKEGHEKIVNYLQSEFNEFKRVQIFYQEENLSPYGNSKFLLEKIKEEGFDRYIILEDDNEASPNFIEYMDKGLEKFEKDDSVIGICGNDRVIVSKDVIDHGEGNYRFSRYMTYGFGTWVSVSDMLYKKCQNGDFSNMVYSFSLMWKLFKVDKALYRRFIRELIYREPVFYYKENLWPIDAVYNIYMALFDKVLIVPNLPKIRNWGLDGSGVNMQAENEVADGICQNLDIRNDFDFDDHIPCMDVAEAEFVSHIMRGKRRAYIVYLMMHIAYCILGEKAIVLREYLLNNNK